jgi:hypothetical protein
MKTEDIWKRKRSHFHSSNHLPINIHLARSDYYVNYVQEENRSKGWIMDNPILFILGVAKRVSNNRFKSGNRSRQGHTRTSIDFRFPPSVDTQRQRIQNRKNLVIMVRQPHAFH